MKTLGLMALLLLAGCGQKGPLYFAPADEPVTVPAQTTEGADQQDAGQQPDDQD